MILKGDCIEVMKAMKPNSVDAIVTDPPYGLEFMGKEWDKLWGENSLGNKPSHSKSPQYLDKWTNQKCLKCGHWINSGTPCKCKDRILEQRSIKNDQFRKMQLWHTQWLTEAYQVLKPGGSMLVMGGTRTSHRLACAIEDSGFIIKDTLMWIYGSGFPKAQDLGKMIDKRGGKNISWFIDYILEIAKERGISKKELTSLFLSKNSKPTGWLYNKSSHTQGLTIEQFNKIKEFLQLPFDSLKEAEREIIGKMKNPATAKAGTFNCSFDEEKKHETAPSTDLAKHWDGFKVGGIKPAYEPIIWAVKPPEGSYIDNVLKWGVGAVNVDETRIGTEPHIVHGKEVGKFQPTGGATIKDYHEVKGRFPANIILSHHPECV